MEFSSNPEKTKGGLDWTSVILEFNMDSSKLILTALKFNEKTNQQDLEGLAELMTTDHTFIDNDCRVTKGKYAMKEGWRDFFAQYPDYRNTFNCVTAQDKTVVMVGYSTCSHKPLDGPNIWTAKVRDGRAAEWRILWLNKR